LDLDINADKMVQFNCNICGKSNAGLAGDFHRELPNCTGCNSTPRFRGIVHALSLGLFKSSIPLSKFPTDLHLKGIGMSEWDVYAKVLAKKFAFTNTFYHQEPKLDVTSEDWKNFQDLDFMICTEVFEHVLQPLEVGFRNMRQMLKKGGVLVFSTPFVAAPHTIEHFPGMTDFTTCKIGDTWLVVSRKADGSYEVYDKNICFHGGPGTVLEMRIFGRDELVAQLGAARFETQILSQAEADIGYYWPTVVDRPEFGFPGEHYIMICRAI